MKIIKEIWAAITFNSNVREVTAAIFRTNEDIRGIIDLLEQQALLNEEIIERVKRLEQRVGGEL